MMFNFNQSKKFLAIVGYALAGLLSFSSVYAANPEPVIAEVEFIAPVTITETLALRYGLLDVNLANAETVVIPPIGLPIDTFGRIAGGIQGAAALTVSGAAQAITIEVDTIVPGPGYALGSFMCNYNSGADTLCGTADPVFGATGVVVGATLLVGATLTGDGTAAAGPADASISVTVTYL